MIESAPILTLSPIVIEKLHQMQEELIPTLLPIDIFALSFANIPPRIFLARGLKKSPLEKTKLSPILILAEGHFSRYIMLYTLRFFP